MDEMKRMGFPPTTETFNLVLDACGRAGHWRRCCAVFARMKPDGVVANTAARRSRRSYTSLNAMKNDRPIFKKFAPIDRSVGQGN